MNDLRKPAKGSMTRPTKAQVQALLALLKDAGVPVDGASYYIVPRRTSGVCRGYIELLDELRQAQRNLNLMTGRRDFEKQEKDNLIIELEEAEATIERVRLWRIRAFAWLGGCRDRMTMEDVRSLQIVLDELDKALEKKP